MSIATKLGNLSDLENKFKKTILDAQEKEMEALAVEVEASMKQDMKETLKGTFPRNERAVFGEKGFSDARPETRTKIDRQEDGIVLTVQGVVADVNGGKHEIWHKLNKGAGRRETNKKGRRVRRRKKSRTSDDLTSESFGGYAEITRNDSGWFTENNDTLKKKIKPRKWYKTMSENLKKRIKTVYEMKVRVNQ